MRKALGLVVCVCLSVAAAHAASPTRISGLNHRVLILEDVEGIPHIIAVDEHDLFFAQGWVHARDRLFQMDVSRRLASGTLAELLGPGALESDVRQAMRRRAVRSAASAEARLGRKKEGNA